MKEVNKILRKSCLEWYSISTTSIILWSNHRTLSWWNHVSGRRQQTRGALSGNADAVRGCIRRGNPDEHQSDRSRAKRRRNSEEVSGFWFGPRFRVHPDARRSSLHSPELLALCQVAVDKFFSQFLVQIKLSDVIFIAVFSQIKMIHFTVSV